MNVFEQHILEAIDSCNMIKNGQTVICAVSGGYDSMCLLNVLYSLRKLRGFDVCVAHINHMYRAEADADEEYVKNQASLLELDFYSKKENVSLYARENKISFETAGRIIRYDFFDEICSKYDDCVIATAHNANDSVESMFMHLMRGSGLKGLLGIRPKNGNIIRPLIYSSREEIEKYCDEKGIAPRHDITNDSDDYKRNDIRHNIVSEVLKRCNINSLSRTMDILSEDEEFLDDYSSSIAKKHITATNNGAKISVNAFNDMPLAIKRRILRIMTDNKDENNQLCLVHIDQIIKIAKSNYGGKKALLPGGSSVKIEKGELIYEKKRN